MATVHMTTHLRCASVLTCGGPGQLAYEVRTMSMAQARLTLPAAETRDGSGLSEVLYIQERSCLLYFAGTG